MFTIDGRVWPWPCKIERVAEVRSSEISGLMLDGSYFNDVYGTYLRYDISVAVPPGERAQYDAFFEALTDPVDGHQFTLPYNQGTVQVTGRIERARDVFVRLPGGGQYWKGMKFTILANHPSRQYTLGQALARGRAPLPELAAVEAGEMYTYTSGGWVRTAYADADESYY